MVSIVTENKTTPYTIRLAGHSDFDALGEAMFDAVRNSRSPYTTEQRQAWVPEIRRGDEWSARLSAQKIFVAEQERDIVGFMSLAANGYIDFAYIRPQHQGTGLFRRLYEQLVKTASHMGETRLWVHASLMAQPAFAAMGFVTLRAESIELRGQMLQRFEMEYYL